MASSLKSKEGYSTLLINFTDFLGFFGHSSVRLKVGHQASDQLELNWIFLQLKCSFHICFLKFFIYFSIEGK